MSNQLGNGQSTARRTAATLGGFLSGFVLGDAGLPSGNGVGTIALAVGFGLLGFAFVR